MKNYRLTQRGKIVFTGLFILVIIALVSMVSYFNSKLDHVGEELMINTNEIEEPENAEEFVNNETASNEETITATDSSADLTCEPLNSTDNESLKSDTDDQKKIEDEKLATLYTIYYCPDDSTINKEGYLLLDEYYNVAITNKSDIIVEGNYHGEKDYNKNMFISLSYNRALFVKDYLVKKGIDEDRIKIINNEDSKPVNKDNSDFEVGLNRRVDIYFKDFYNILK